MTETRAAQTVTSDEVRAVVERVLAQTFGPRDAERARPDETVRATIDEPVGVATTAPPMHTEELPLVAVRRPEDATEAPTTEWNMRALLGVGGMGEVYSGEQRSIGRVIAMKMATSDAGGDALLREARITGRLEHPNIVPVHVLGVDDRGVAVMVMKRIEGVSWRTLLRDREHSQWRRWETQHRDALEAHVSVLLSVCDALEYAHQKRVIHRDIKPDNVMIGPFGEVYLLDWGIALELDAPPPRNHALCGTPAYMPPELVAPELSPPSPATDVYLLGATLYEALEGRPPHDAPNLFQTIAHAYASDPPAFSKDPPPALAKLCAEAMRRAPGERTESVAAFRAGLRQWLAHRDSLASSALGQQLLDSDARSRALDARLAFERALRLWPDNTQATDGLARAIRLMFLSEIARNHGTAARASLAELEALGAALPEDHAALSALDARLAAERAETARANEAQRQLDLSGWRGARVWLFASVTFACALAGALIGRAPAPTFAMLLPADVAIVAIIVVAIAALRRRLTANRIGRQLAAVLLLCALASTAVDALGLALGWPVLWASAHRLLAIGATLAFAALIELRALFVSAALAGAGAVAVVLVPERQATIVPAVLLGINVVTGWLVSSGRIRSTDAID